MGTDIRDGVLALFVIGCILSAFIGWGVIEFLIWLFSHIAFV